MEFYRKFVVTTDSGKDGSKLREEVADVAACNRSVSLTVRGRCIHIPWTEIAIWMSELAKQTEED